MNAKKCDRCGAYYDKNKKHETVGRISGGTILGMQTVAQHFEWDQYFDLCDECVGELKKFLNIKEPDKE